MPNDDLPLFPPEESDVTRVPGVDPARGTSEHAPPDMEARVFATDPRHDVVLEASAGTGKTSVLVGRYARLLGAGVDPSNILALTFTRKAAAEMRARIVGELRVAAACGAIEPIRWRELRDRLGDIDITTIDAFCLSLLREYPLEADLDPGFAIADETEVPRLVEEALDRALRIGLALTEQDADVALLVAHLGLGRLRAGLVSLLERRLVAPAALNRYLAAGPPDLTVERACESALERLERVLEGAPGGLTAFLATGPTRHPRFRMLADDLGNIRRLGRRSSGEIRSVLDRVRDHFLTRASTPRARLAYRRASCRTPDDWRRHAAVVRAVAPDVAEVLRAFNRDLNVIQARGVRRLYAIALDEYRHALDRHAVLDFSEVLARALELLRHMDEFSRSRYRLESRYHHVLLDEFQDTSRAQWELVSLLVQSWGEGFGLVHDAPLPPSIFVVADRKQSIYGFRDAQVALLDEVARYIDALRSEGTTHRWISHSFRAVPTLLAFVNDVCRAMAIVPGRPGVFRYDERDAFPVPSPDPHADMSQSGPGVMLDTPLGVVIADRVDICARAVADEVLRLLADVSVRDPEAGVARRARPGDIAILFRSRESHRAFQAALESLGVPAYVYKGLGFFEADEIKDVTALLRFLADPGSDLCAAAFLRSRLVRLSDDALARIAPEIARVARGDVTDERLHRLDGEDRQVLELLRTAVPGWLALVDRLAPSELLDRVLAVSAYAFEWRAGGRLQARENLKKLRGLVRRIENRGFLTLSRLADHLDRLSAGDESTAVVQALDAVNLMTIHASKGLEFPIVFMVNLTRGVHGARQPIRVSVDGLDEDPQVAIGDERVARDVAQVEREAEETKRLLYVALTRARDRLYLSASSRRGRLMAGRGSLAEVLPADLLAALEGATAGAATVTWASAGRSYRLRVCTPGPTSAARRTADESERSVSVAAAGPDDDFEPLVPRHGEL